MRSKPEIKPASPGVRLTIALAISALLHLCLFWSLAERPGPGPIKETTARTPQSAAQTPPKSQAPSEKSQPPIKPKPRHIPMIFVETDNSQPAGAPPEDTKFYGKQNTVAANPKPDPNKPGDTPRVEGTQDRVPSVTDVPFVSLPRSAAPPPPPSNVKDKQSSNARPESAAIPGSSEKAQTAPQEKPPLTEKQASIEGPLTLPAVATPPQPAVQKNEPRPPQSNPNAPPQQQVAAVQQPPSPPAPPLGAVSSQRQIPARAAKLSESSASLRGNVSLNVKGTPFGIYDEKLVAAVSRRWHLSLQDKFFFDRRGSVVVEFLLKQDGSVENARIIEESVGPVLAAACLNAVVDCAPYEPFTKEMRELLGGKPREIRFTFFY